MTPMTSTTQQLRQLLVPFISKRVDPQDVDDVLQTVFVRIQRGIVELRDGDKLVAWAYQIARNAIVDHARHVAVRRHEPIDHASALPAPDEDDDGGARLELARIVGHFIAMLPDPYREALQMT
jgi:RNA polymerase sigma-70 factor (ECF subfamily)